MFSAAMCCGPIEACFWQYITKTPDGVFRSDVLRPH